MQMLLSALFEPTSPYNPRLAVCVPEGSEAEQSDRGTWDQERKKGRVIALGDRFS